MDAGLPSVEALESISVEGTGMGLAELRARENEELRAQIRALELQLEEVRTAPTGAGKPPEEVGSGGVAPNENARVLKIQIRELEAYQAQLERERSEFASKVRKLEGELEAMHSYVNDNLGRYQAEILRLRSTGRR